MSFHPSSFILHPFLCLGLILQSAVAGVCIQDGRPAPMKSCYVSPTRSDSNPGTIELPWRTVTKGLVSLQPGYTLYLRGGVYKERIKNPLIRLGSPTLPITVTAFPRERPVIQGLLW